MAKAKTAQVRESQLGRFVFMDKTIGVLDAGIKTQKNVVLYGPGGHGKSEVALEFLLEKGITPYIFTCGAGTTAEKLFGGFDIKEYESTGKLHYLLDNSLFNHEYVILEEMMDCPDYILESLKDSLSSGYYRNGSQVYEIKTKFIIACTNKTRAEFSKNDSLRALMERFPLEHNVIWDNYNEVTYNTLLETTFGKGKVDPIIPFILQQYHINGITISPRIALDLYEVYEVCGPDKLVYIADLAKKPEIISEGLKKYEETVKFKKLGSEMEELVTILHENKVNDPETRQAYIDGYQVFDKKLKEVKKLQVTEESAAAHAGLVKKMTTEQNLMETKYYATAQAISDSGANSRPAEKKTKKSVIQGDVLDQDGNVIGMSPADIVEAVKTEKTKRVYKSKATPV